MDDCDDDFQLTMMMLVVPWYQQPISTSVITMACDAIVIISHVIHQIIIVQYIFKVGNTYNTECRGRARSRGAGTARASPLSPLATARQPLRTTTKR